MFAGSRTTSSRVPHAFGAGRVACWALLMQKKDKDVLPALSRVLGQRRYIFSPRERDKLKYLVRPRPGTTMAGRIVSGRKMPLTRKPAVSACRSRCLALRGQAWHARMSMSEPGGGSTPEDIPALARRPIQFPRGSHEAGGGVHQPSRRQWIWVGGGGVRLGPGRGYGVSICYIRRHRGET